MLRHQSTFHSNYKGIQAGSECNKVQDHIICNIGTSRQFDSAMVQRFIWLTLTYDGLELRHCTTPLLPLYQWHQSAQLIAIGLHDLNFNCAGEVTMI